MTDANKMRDYLSILSESTLSEKEGPLVPHTGTRDSSDVSYSAIKKGGEITKVVAQLKRYDSARYTKLGRNLKRLERISDRVKEIKEEVKQDTRELVADLFHAEDACRTRMVETVGFILQLTKDPEATHTPQYKKILDELANHMTPELITMMENLKKQYVTISQKAPGLTMRDKEQAAEAVNEASFDKIMGKLKSFFGKFRSAVDKWANDYDDRLDRLKAEVKMLEGPRLEDRFNNLTVDEALAPGENEEEWTEHTGDEMPAGLDRKTHVDVMFASGTIMRDHVAAAWNWVQTGKADPIRAWKRTTYPDGTGPVTGYGSKDGDRHVPISNVSYKDHEATLRDRMATMSEETNPLAEGYGSLKYGDWIIHSNTSGFGGDWAFHHDDYDGAEDANDNRYGYATSIEDAKAQIDDKEDELGEVAITEAHSEVFLGDDNKFWWTDGDMEYGPFKSHAEAEQACNRGEDADGNMVSGMTMFDSIEEDGDWYSQDDFQDYNDMEADDYRNEGDDDELDMSAEEASQKAAEMLSPAEGWVAANQASIQDLANDIGKYADNFMVVDRGDYVELHTTERDSVNSNFNPLASAWIDENGNFYWEA